MSMYAMI